MSLVTIERSSSSDNLSQISGERAESEEDQVDAEPSEDVFARSRATSSVEGFFASKGAAYAIPDGDFARKASLKGGELQSHLQGMVNLIRDEDTMRLVVKVESEATYIRYLCIVTTYGLSDEEESVILGIDWIEDQVTLGLVIPLWSNVSTTLDGDGGFEIKTEHRKYIFKPVSVQTLWTALLWIHKCLNSAHKAKHFDGGLSHAWLDYYYNRISSPRECINFWESMDDVTIKREICLSYFDKVKTDEELLKGSIRNKLKEILTRFDLEEVTCRQVREALEAEMKMSLQHLKGYVEEQLFVILGQMESATKITDHLYLGSEWNACNLEELKENGVDYILNITKEVDNFFPGTFEYMNVRLYDVKEAELLPHWGKTYRFIHKAKERGSSTLVHCRRGISRSASTVIAYIMKEQNMSLADAMKFVKTKRSIVQPNSGFWKQLIIYEGILKSSRHRHSNLFHRRSNSDAGNLGRPHSKKAKHKSNADHADGASERAQTMPRIANKVSPVDERGGVSPSEGREDWNEGQSPESISSSEDISSNSNSDEEHPSKMRVKIRRTVSEPVMLRMDELKMTSPTQKPRARTFVERQAVDAVRSPTKIAEDLENEDDGIWMQDASEGDGVDVSEEANVELSESMSECVNPESEHVAHAEPITPDENVDVMNETQETDHEKDITLDDTKIAEQNAGTGETEPTEVSHDGEQVACEQSPRVDSLRDSPHEDVESPRGDVNSPRDSNDAVQRTPRQRSRSIGEKLEDKAVVKQVRSESLDNFKKVSTRGRVKRRERKAKSDLQLSSSGFVKRHTQIIEEHMLYSLLRNSDKTLATLTTDFWETNGGNDKPDIRKNTVSREMPKNSENDITDSEKISERGLEDCGNVGVTNSANIQEALDCTVTTEEGTGSGNLQNSEKDKQINSTETSLQRSETECQNTSENCSGKNRSQELQNIVQAVNAEAKRDIATQADSTRAAVVVQNDLRHSSNNDDVTIDEMTMIDLTQHHGDVVKRRSAAFENNAKGTRASWSPSRDNLPRSRDRSPQSRDEPNTSLELERTQGTRMDDNTKTRSSSLTTTDIPKLDLRELTGDGCCSQRSNSIIVDDYNSWEASSVRDRTKILESIIAKTGGSFPSPRSRVKQDPPGNSEVEGQLQQEMNALNINTSSTTEKESISHQSHGADREAPEQAGAEDLFGDAPVRSLVDKFEDWG